MRPRSAAVSVGPGERRRPVAPATSVPAFDQSARAADFFKEEAEAAVLGMKTPQQAMDDLVRRVQPLLG